MAEIRINKFIANAGVCSRRNAEKYILAGRIKVNGQVVTELATQVKPEDIVELDGKRISIATNKKYIMLNKPIGYITTSKEQFSRRSVLDLIDLEERVYPIGRLDMDSHGLLLLTNDGELTNNIIHPTKHISKQYEVRLKYNIKNEDIEKLKQGVDIGGYITRPAEVVKINNNTIIITIYEGKNRQIRRMCETIGNKVVDLKRVSIGNLKLGELKEGEYIELNDEDINKIFA